MSQNTLSNCFYKLKTSLKARATRPKCEAQLGKKLHKAQALEQFVGCPSETKTALEQFPKSVTRFSDKNCGKNKELEQSAEPSETKTALDHKDPCKNSNFPHINASLEASLLLEWACGATLKDILLTPHLPISKQTFAKLDEALAQLQNGKSLYRIIGKREFYGLPFELSPETLEPRPDSETLVDLILPIIEQFAKQHSKKTIHLLDMGTGSGCLSISLLAHIPQLHVQGVDLSPGALMMAQKNAQLNGVEQRFHPLLSDGFEKVQGLYDFIISNPPYIKRPEIPLLDRNVRDFDPILALDGGVDGLDFYRYLAKTSAKFLSQSGQIGLEIGHGQEHDVEALFCQQGFSLLDKKKDLNGICRTLLFRSNF